MIIIRIKQDLNNYQYQITTPYLLSSTSALTKAGHKRRRARRAKNRMDIDDARRYNCVLVVRREN